MSVQGLNLSQVQSALISGTYPNEWATNLAALTQKGLTVSEFASEVERVTDGYVKATMSQSGNIIGYTVKGVAQESITPVTTNSNSITLARGTISAPVATTVEAGQTAVRTSRLAGVGTKIVTGASKLALPLALASVGITLGKTIDEIAYNANPQFWEDIGLSTVNPQTWSSIAGGDGTFGGSFINAIFGIDPSTGETQAYMDANALAYSAFVMQTAGLFNSLETADSSTLTLTRLNSPVYRYRVSLDTLWDSNKYISIIGTAYRNDRLCYLALAASTQMTLNYIYGNVNGSKAIFAVGDSGERPGYGLYAIFADTMDRASQMSGSTRSFTLDSKTATYWYLYDFSSVLTNISFYAEQSARSYVNNDWSGTLDRFGWCARYGTYDTTSSVDGIGNQSGATIPDFSNLSENQYLPYLQQTYPDMFSDAITYPVVQPDGTIKQYTYVPVTLPYTDNQADTQPVSGTQTQAQPAINPATAPQELIDLLTEILQQPITEPITDTPQPPENPTDTGEGSSPVPVVPVGSASALWKIYHPTQSQIDSFGGWLWSSNFIDQILKIFNNPMEAVIGLHKVYATPIDAGTSTIKVGYLDSQVPSAYIEQQYIDVSCGSVNLYEQFGNVFDYSPFTDVQLYLPFVGIVPLNVVDIMRSAISINYGVDVITGACLAQVEVSRDGNSSILYQYSGNCAVQYPISSGSYMGIVSSIISVAGGVAATVASGGAAAPLALGAAGGLLSARTSVQHSGGFSGNAGAMGGKIPYLIITRPQTKVAINAETMQGYPTNNYVTVGECSGYIKADSVHVINVNATDDELTEINNLLLSGIII